jgi:hypothetical protein
MDIEVLCTTRAKPNTAEKGSTRSSTETLYPAAQSVAAAQSLLTLRIFNTLLQKKSS